MSKDTENKSESKQKKQAKPWDAYMTRTLLLAVAAFLGIGIFTGLLWRIQSARTLQSVCDSAVLATEQLSAKYDNGVTNKERRDEMFNSLYAGRAAAMAIFCDAAAAEKTAGDASPVDATAAAGDKTEQTDQTEEIQLETTFNETHGVVTPPVSREKLAELAAQMGAAELYLLDDTGKTLVSSAGYFPIEDKDQLDQLYSGRSVKAEPLYRVFFAAQCQSGWAVLAVDISDEILYGGEHLLFEDVISQSFGDGGTVMVINTASNTFDFAPEGFTGADIADAGLSAGQLTADFRGWVTIGNEEYYAVCDSIGENYIVAGIEPRYNVRQTTLRFMVIPLLVFVMVELAVVLYSALLILAYRRERADIRYKRIGGVYLDVTLTGRLMPVAMVAIVLLAMGTLYAQTLLGLSAQSLYAKIKLNSVNMALQMAKSNTGDEQQSYEENCMADAAIVAWMVEEAPQLTSQEGLQQLAQALGAGQADLFNGKGVVQYSSTDYDGYALGTSEKQQTYALRDLIQGDNDKMLIPTCDEEEVLLTGKPYTCMAAVRRRDGAGLVRLTFSSENLTYMLQGASPEGVIDTTSVATGECVLLIDGSEKRVYNATWIDYWGCTLQELGLEEDILDDQYTGYQRINGMNCFLNGSKIDSDYLYISVEDRFLQQGRFAICLREVLAGLGVVLVLLLLAVVGFGETPPPLVASPKEKQVTVTLSDGKTRRMDQDKARLYKSVLRWSEKSPEGKFRTLMMGLLGGCVLFSAAVIYRIESSDAPDPIVDYILRGQWKRGANVFAITDCIMVVALVLIISWIIRTLISLLLRSAGRPVAGAQMLDGAIKYGSMVGVGLYCLNLLGIKTTTLVTSASVATVVLGLGAQSLIGDILAGIFIVLENEFRVGDIVTVDTWRGVVREIGIRTTKIEDIYGNIKIFNNAQISGVINMTKEYSVAECDVSIEYGESLPRVEAVLKEQAFPQMREHLPAIKKGPFYAGVVQLAESGVLLRVTAQCEEDHRIMLERDINRELKLVFDENHINIPFPQVVVHTAAEPSAAQVLPESAAKEKPADTE